MPNYFSKKVHLIKMLINQVLDLQLKDLHKDLETMSFTSHFTETCVEESTAVRKNVLLKFSITAKSCKNSIMKIIFFHTTI